MSKAKKLLEYLSSAYHHNIGDNISPMIKRQELKKNSITEGYELNLTSDDIKTIAFVGDRYSWSAILSKYSEGENDIPEHEAWEIKDAFEEDMEGGHSIFPMLDPDSELYDKLLKFYNSIV